MKKIFIHTNNRQLTGATLAKFAIERYLPKNSEITIELINVDKLSIFAEFSGKEYLSAGKTRIYDPRDLQSFTLSRFMPPELMGYEGKALVIDPDIFAITDISPIFEIDLKGKAVACCPKKTAYDTSFMLMDCAKLTHWRVGAILQKLADKELDYAVDVMSLKHEPEDSILALSRIWNSLDLLTPETKALHMTNRLTQPWSTGLPIDFTRNPLPKVFGLIPREPIYKLLGKYPTRYQPHPNKNIEIFFFRLVAEALEKGATSREWLQTQIDRGYLRKDLWEKLN